MSLTLNEFNKLKDTIYSFAGISLKDNKMDFLARRVDARMKALDLRAARDYLRYLIFNPNGDEMNELISLIVIPETYFFRDYPQLKLLAEEVLPAALKEKGKGHLKKLSFLCAGCSTGEEPYTLAIILREMLDNVDEWDLRIDGVDINNKVLAKARQANYSDHALRGTPYAYRDKYFTQKDADYVLNPEIRGMVKFIHANLFDPRQMSEFLGYDFVLCRNVLSYFDYSSGEQVLQYLYDAMNSGGFIFLGTAESVGRMTTIFRMVRFGKSFVYQK